VGRCSEDLGVRGLGKEGYNAGVFLRPCYRKKDSKRVRAENRKDFGGPWLVLQLIKELGLSDLLAGTIPATIGRTASRSASAWWCRSAGCRWVTRFSPATGRTFNVAAGRRLTTS
jgi:hypothetical protein